MAYFSHRINILHLSPEDPNLYRPICISKKDFFIIKLR